MTLRTEELMIVWAREAGALALGHERGADLNFKAGREAVTAADLQIEQLLRRRIAEAFPDDEVVGEEMDGDPAATATRIWQLDPIDGTLNFALGLPDYCVSLALVQDGDPLAACVHQPVTGEFWTATRGHGARRNGETISVSSRASLADGIVSAQVRKRGRFGRNPALLQALVHDAYKLRKVGAVVLELAWVAAAVVSATRITSTYTACKQELDVMASPFVSRPSISHRAAQGERRQHKAACIPAPRSPIVPGQVIAPAAPSPSTPPPGGPPCPQNRTTTPTRTRTTSSRNGAHSGNL